jgi:hypothetical protein
MKQSHAVWLSGDGLRLAYATFNDSAVSAVRWTIYGDSDHLPGTSPYPKLETMRYPKVTSHFSYFVCVNFLENGEWQK